MTPGEGTHVLAGDADFIVVANRLPIDMERLPDGTTPGNAVPAAW